MDIRRLFLHGPVWLPDQCVSRKCLVALSTGNEAFDGHPDGWIKRLDFLAGIL